MTGDGASHFLPATDVTYASPCNNNSPLIDSVIDGTGYVLTINNATVSTVRSSGGATVVQTSVSCGFDDLGTCYGGTVTDSNGNVLAVSDSSPFDVTDTMGVTALVFSGRSTTSSSFAWNDVTGHQQSMSVAYTTEGIATGFSCSPGPADYYPAVNEALPTSITFADGRALGISYETTPGHSADTTGRVAGLTLPETGTVSYSYGQGTVSGCSNGINGTYGTVPVLTRTLGNGDTTTYTLTYSNPSGSNYNATNTRVDPGGNKTIFTFSGLTSTGNQVSPAAQVITEVQKYQGTSTLLTTDLYSYNTAFSGTPSSSTISTTVNSFPFTKLVVYHQISGMSNWSATETHYDGYGNVVYSAQYDFGATTPTRSTTITYGSCTASCATSSPTISNSSMATDGVYNKPGEIVVRQNGITVAQTNITYDARGDLLSKQVWTGSAFIGQTTANVYNANGTIAKAYDLGNNETDYSYASGSYSDNCGTIFPFPTTVKNVGTGLSTSSTYDCEGGVKLTDVDANGNTTTYGYETTSGVADPYWRANSVTDPYSAVAYKIYPTGSSPDTSGSSFEFNSNNSIEATTLTTDGYGRPINSQKDQSVSGTTFDTLSTSYAWQTSGTYNNYFETLTSQPCPKSLNGSCTGVHASYSDPLGRTYVSTTTSNETVTNTFSNNGTTSVYTLSALTPAPAGETSTGKRSQVGYDGLGRITSICHIGSTASTGSGTACPSGSYNGAVDTYAYGQGSGYTTVSVTRGNQTRTNTYDALGRLIKKVTPEGGTWNYAYDTTTCGAGGTGYGNLLCVTDPNGNWIINNYDSLNRVTYVGAGAGGFTACKRFSYDNSSGVLGSLPTGVTLTNQYGRMVEAETDDCTYPVTLAHQITDEWFAYDKDGRVLNYWQSTSHSTQYYQSTATYYANGAVDTIQLASPSLYTLTYGLDGEGRWDTLKDGSNMMVTGPTNGTMYDAAGHVLNVRLTGTTPDQDIYTYDSNTGRMKTFEFEVGNTPANLEGTLTWNPNGTLANVAVVDGFNSGGSSTCYSDSNSWLGYGYDDWGRLLAFDCGSGNVAEYTQYDIYDNVTMTIPPGRTGWTFSPGYNSSNNQVIGNTYDTNGNTTADGGSNTFGYNEFSKMKWTATSGTPTCGSSGKCVTNDAFGRMVETSNGSAWVELWYPQVPGARVTMNGTTQSFAYWPSPGRGTYIESSTKTFIHPDWLGNDRIVSAISSHTVSADRDYTPYGQQFNSFGSANPIYGVFAGMSGDYDSGTLFDTPNREFAVNQLRWTSPDPAGSGWNQYAYPTNPNSLVDPSGLHTCAVGSAGCIGGIQYSNPTEVAMDWADAYLWGWGLFPGGGGDGGAGGSSGSVGADSGVGSTGTQTSPPLCGCPDDLAWLGAAAAPFPSEILDQDAADAAVFLQGCGGQGIPCNAVLNPEDQPDPDIEYAEDGSILYATQQYNWTIEDSGGNTITTAQTTEWVFQVSQGGSTYNQLQTAYLGGGNAPDFLGFPPDYTTSAFLSVVTLSVQVEDGGPDYLLNMTIVHGAWINNVTGSFGSFANPTYGTQY